MSTPLGRIAQISGSLVILEHARDARGFSPGDTIALNPMDVSVPGLDGKSPMRNGRLLVASADLVLGTVTMTTEVLEAVVAAADMDFMYRSASHAKDLAMIAWFAARGATNAGQWPGDPEDCDKQNRARDDFEAWWVGR